MNMQDKNFIKKSIEASEVRIQSSITDLARHMTASFGHERQHTDHQFTEVNVKLDAIMESVVIRKEVHNLVREIKRNGLDIDDSKVFVM